MAWHNPTAALRTHWQNQLETSLEAGEPPLLDLGFHTGVLEGVPGLVALHAFAEARMDLTAPTLISSGSSLLWLAALLHPHNRTSPRSPNLTVIYGGADLATHLASMEMQRVRSPAHSQADGLPESLAILFAPGAQSGPLLWEALPFAVAEERQRSVGSPDQSSRAGSDPWLTWAAMILAVGLIVVSLFV